jgi:cytochrome c6
MRLVLPKSAGIGLAVAAGVAVAISSAGAGANTVRVSVKPLKVKTGQRLTVTAKVNSVGRRCSLRITRPGARPVRLAAREASNGKVSWGWKVPKTAKAGKGTARVACSGAGVGSKKFVIVAPATPPPPPPPPTSGDPAAGKSVFLGNCGGCHTLRDAGTRGVVGPNLDERMPSYDKVVDRVTNGRGIMPSFRGRLSEKEIADVAAYVSTVAGR